MTGGQPAPRRVALVKLSSLGDVIHALPVARALRRAWPGAHLTWVVEERERALLRGHPDLDAVVTVDTRRWRRLAWRPGGAAQVWRDVRAVRARLRAAGVDVALDLQGLLKSGALAWLTGAPVRVGFAAARCREPLSAVFTTRRVTPPAAAVHVVEQYLALLGPLGVAPGPPEFHVPLRPEAARRMEEFLGVQGIKRRDRLVAFNPGAGRPEKRWPVAHFTALGERLAADPGVRLLLLWGPDEVHMARQIRDGCAGPALLAPPTDLDELAALLARCALLVAADTGPLHLAAALGTPAVGLFGPTRAARNGPWGPRCRGLQSPDGTMAGLDPERVLEAARALLEAGEARP